MKKNYRVFLENGEYEDIREVTEVEMSNLNGSKTLIFWFEHLGTNYIYAMKDVYAFSVWS